MAKLEIEHFDDELLLDLERRASLNGCSVEDELNSVLRRALGKEILNKAPKLTPEERVKAFQDMIARHGVRGVPPLSDEAISRESIYGERG